MKRAWADIFHQAEPVEKREQVAALCYKMVDGAKKVLLITSRDTGRWIVPKGWPIKGKNGAEAALQEAWEEAGVKKADIIEEPMGHFGYIKGLNNGEDVPVEAEVYLVHVRGLKEDYPEVDQRERAWFSPTDAAKLVREPDLKEILRSL
ncbi:Hydrolase, nudix family [Sulfitobacter noctilucicola]|nr:Hydrolase, nudix family [Sulfitobacter noctilucicola]